MQVNDKLQALRNLMREKGITAYIIPSSDNHISEYVCNYFKSREWISGFTGSAGTVLVTLKEAYLWVDGRYHIQADKEVTNTEFIVQKLGSPNVDTLNEWIKNNLTEEDVVSFNGKTMSMKIFNNFKSDTLDKNITFKVEEDLMDILWKDRPILSKEKLFIHELKFTGLTAIEKINLVREKLEKESIESALITSLDDIAWLLNLRGNDIDNNPVFLSYVLLNKEECILYIDNNKIDENIINYLKDNRVDVKSYEDIQYDLYSIEDGQVLTCDYNKTNVWLYNSIPTTVEIKDRVGITTELKAIKNKVELENLERCQIKDGVAMVKFIKWLKENANKFTIDEIIAANKLESFRKEQEFNLGVSFDSISAYKENAAMMHYKATHCNKSILEPKGFYLIDSGGQYLDGTTDITRTIALGQLSEQEKEDFTLTLKGHIALNKIKFLEGTCGCNLDILARQFLWEHGIDYKCGTGHGVGYLLNVHEGPQGFSRILNNVKLEEGMVLTNEPGVYKEGRYGIRIENTLTVKPWKETEFGKFFKFQVISYCPIELEAIDINLLKEEEITWLNDYHETVYNKLKNYLNEEESNWLKKYTRKI
ncbi:aminopeptidase P family protein [Clostridium tarantellae]|uniref:M24 family metallopeptidase n=1 Tax=Clostridium tarantellae TaxID=39493 RepID=A0A6I1MS79_9CLOT|nr:aminopeptidase P family protein [Clostridium tarantellae]MPQ45047.1 M24 family metallopeptidase [Clostridium tarantellae]